MSVKIFKGEHAVVEHAKDIARYGRKALIVTGRYSAKHNGALLDVQRAMDETGTKYEVFDKVEENPSVETVMEARDFGVSKGVDFVIGIGGGSPMDAAKAIHQQCRTHNHQGQPRATLKDIPYFFEHILHLRRFF